MPDTESRYGESGKRLLDEAEELFGGLPDYEIAPEKTALVCIDLAWVQMPGHGLSLGVKNWGLNKIYDYYCAEITKVLPRVRRIQEVCRAAGIEIVHVHGASVDEVGRDRCPIMKVVDAYVTEAVGVEEGIDYSAFIESVAPEDDELVIPKTTPGVFTSSSIDQRLRSMGIDTLVFVGEVTNACVESSVREAADRGYKVFLVSDACSTWTEKGQADGLRVMGRWFARLATTARIIEKIKQGSPRVPGDIGLTEVDPGTPGAMPKDYYFQAYEDLTKFFRGMPDFDLVPHKTALVILDMQRLLTDPHLGLGKIALDRGLRALHDYYFGEIERVIHKIEQLKTVCRAAGIEVLYSQIASGTKDCRDLLPVLRHYGLMAPRGSEEAQAVQELEPSKGDLVIPRGELGLFTAPDADQALRNMGIDTLLFTGVMTNVSVETSARMAAELGYKVCVVEDACAALTPADHQEGLEILGWVWSTLATTDELVKHIEAARLAAFAYW